MLPLCFPAKSRYERSGRKRMERPLQAEGHYTMPAAGYKEPRANRLKIA
jgi:hypothetical protein